MGMSSSQARLLSLTSRMHDIEYKAQHLEAQKLQMANESCHVYQEYEKALDSIIIQSKVINADGSVTFHDATLAMLENGLIPGYSEGITATNPLLLQEVSSGKIMLTPEYADYLGITEDFKKEGSLEDYLLNTFGQVQPYAIKTVTYPKIEIEDPNSVATYIGLNSSHENYTCSYTYNPVPNGYNGFKELDFSEPIDMTQYANFNATHTTYTVDNSSVFAISDVSDFISGNTYVISNASDLNKLRTMANSGKSTAGATFVLSNNISDMSAYNWDGIQNFQGVFDGNGYTIGNLTGSQGLFASTKKAELRNINLQNININGSSDSVGGLVGFAEDTNVITNISVSGTINNSSTTSFNQDRMNYDNPAGTGGVIGFYYAGSTQSTSIDNISSNVNVTGAGYNIGGIFGCYFIMHGHKDYNLDNLYSIGDINGGTNVGGIAGYYKFDPDNGKLNDSSNFLVAGNINGDNKVGGFVGVLSCWDDFNDEFSFSDIVVAADISGGTSAGIIIGNNNAVTNTTEADFINCSYRDSDELDLVGSTTSGTTTISKLDKGMIPSTTGLKSNILGVMIKANAYDPMVDDLAEMQSKIDAFLGNFNDNNTDNLKLYYLNEQICEYLNASSPTDAQNSFAQALVNDINNGSTSNTSAYQIGEEIDQLERATTNQAWVPIAHVNPGSVTLPSYDNLAQEIVYAYLKARGSGDVIDIDQAKAFLNNYNTSSKTDMAALAKISDMLRAYGNANTTSSDMNNLLTAVKNTQKYENGYLSYIDDPNHYNINYSLTSETIGVTHKRKLVDDTEHPNISWSWNYEQEDVKKAVQRYNMGDAGYIIIGDDSKSVEYEYKDAHKSVAWLSNVVNEGIVQLVKINTDKKEGESEFIVVSVATETSLQEVSNKNAINEAEAIYEAAMRRINNKDRKYDTDLSALEVERNAIKTEMDTLKNVIQENADRTFKLFS